MYTFSRSYKTFLSSGACTYIEGKVWVIDIDTFFLVRPKSIYLEKGKAKYNHAMLCFAFALLPRYHGDSRIVLLERKRKEKTNMTSTMGSFFWCLEKGFCGGGFLIYISLSHETSTCVAPLL